MPKHITAIIISNKELSKNCFRMELKAPTVAKIAKPGQFVHIRCGSSTDPLLRRPISIHKINKNSIVLLYNAVGIGTEILSNKKHGDTLDLIGPLGNGFSINKNTDSIKMLVAGGMGVAPLFALAEELKKVSKRKIVVILGAKSKNHILCEKEFKLLGAEVYVATEDGSKGKKSLATDLAALALKQHKKDEIAVYSAGPMGMIKAICRLMEGCSLESQVSLEEKMACGLGACLGCVVDMQQGYKRVCKDGPVFRLCDVVCE